MIPNHAFVIGLIYYCHMNRMKYACILVILYVKFIAKSFENVATNCMIRNLLNTLSYNCLEEVLASLTNCLQEDKFGFLIYKSVHALYMYV